MSLARVQRAGFEDELFASGGAHGNACLEKQDSLALRYGRRSTAHGLLYVSYFAKRLDANGLVRTPVQNKIQSRPVGMQGHHGQAKCWGGALASIGRWPH